MEAEKKSLRRGIRDFSGDKKSYQVNFRIRADLES